MYPKIVLKKTVCFHCKKSHPSMLHNTERETAENAHDSKVNVNSYQNQSENKTVTLISARSNVKDGRRVVTSNEVKRSLN